MDSFLYKEFYDNRNQRALPNASKVGAGTNAEAWLLLRLLSGSVAYKHFRDASFQKLQKNYLRSDLNSYSTNWYRDLPAYFSSDLEFVDLSKIYTVRGSSNNKFYQSLRIEFSHFLLHSRKGSHTSAFIYLYRMLEYSAFAVPMMYLSAQKDFIGSYTSLKNWMSSGSIKGELGLFKNFVASIFNGDDILSTTLKISLSSDLPSETEALKKVILKVTKEAKITSAFYVSNEIELPFTHMGSFIICLRNRFYHYQNMQPGNFQSKEIPDSDALFSLVNDVCMNWMATVLSGLIQKSILTDS